MTYLELVNAVLTRMREDTVATLTAQGDVVVELVKDFVNDAVSIVESAHNWSGLYTEWTESTTAGSNIITLTNTKKYAKINYVYLNDNGVSRLLTNQTLDWMNYRDPFDNAQQNTPAHWAVTSSDPTTKNVRIRLYPKPDAVYDVKVIGYKRENELSADADTLSIPDRPVFYLALALAARERGEVGGQTAAELFLMANNYLSDAIALDAAMSDLDNMWEVV